MSKLRLITERANYNALKVVISALYTKIENFSVSLSGNNGDPIIEGLRKPLFNCNEASKYIFNRDLTSSEIELLEWEESSFANAIRGLYTQRIVSDTARNAILKIQSKITEISDSPLASIVYWCSLLPALCDDGLFPSEQKNDILTVCNWWNKYYTEKQELIFEAFSQLGVQEITDFLRCRRIYHMSNLVDKTFYITTPIYYVNAAPHIGHVYSTLIADVIAKYHSIKGEKTYFMTGCDEHGQKVAESAEALNLLPKQFCDKVSSEFKKCFDDMKLHYDYFVRTTDDTHEQNITEMWKKLEEKGDIYLGKYEGWYCVSDEAFSTSTNVTDGFDAQGKPCKVTVDSNKPVVWISEDNYMFKLSKYQQPILNWLKSNPGCIVPDFRRREMIKFVEGGLNDLSISRKKSACKWGLPIPGTDEHVMYVWLDALGNYVTSARINEEGHLDNVNYKSRWPADIHVIGKDILKFHAVYWPAFLMGMGYELPKTLVVHGWWTKDGNKISKSLGNVFDPFEKAQQFGHDALRYFLLRESSFGDDGDYSDKNMILRLNSELADTFGNLVMRCIAPKINVKSEWTEIGTELESRDLFMIDMINELSGNVDHYFMIPDIQRAIMSVFDVLRELNNYTTDNAPWRLVNEDTARLNTVLYIIMEGTRICSSMLQPILCDTCTAILDQLNVPQELRIGVESFKVGKMKAGTKLREHTDKPWFPKVVEPGQEHVQKKGKSRKDDSK